MSLFKSLSQAVGQFRVVSLLEGMSYVWLMGIAMPLKYVWGQPEMVSLAGRIHGALFVLFVVALARAWSEASWNWRRAAVAMVASMVPLGAFWLEWRFREEDRARLGASSGE